MLDVVFVLLTVMVFAALALVVRALERLVGAPAEAAPQRDAAGGQDAPADASRAMVAS